MVSLYHLSRAEQSGIVWGNKEIWKGENTFVKSLLIRRQQTISSRAPTLQNISGPEHTLDTLQRKKLRTTKNSSKEHTLRAHTGHTGHSRFSCCIFSYIFSTLIFVMKYNWQIQIPKGENKTQTGEQVWQPRYSRTIFDIE